MDFSDKDFETAFKKANLSEHQKQILTYNYGARGHTITSKQMATKFGYDHHGSANLHYGKLASKIGEILEIEEMPSERIGIFVKLFNVNNEWNWILKPQVCQALENLNWVEPQEFISPEEEIDSVFTEGTSKTVSVNIYERNPIARRACIEHFGTICQICSIDLGEVYGEIGQDFIHVHHKIEISQIGKNYQVNPLTDLIPVCPNCHAMLHRRKPAYNFDELKEFMKNKRQ